MRVIKLALISFILLFLLITFFSLFIPGNISLSKATNIAADDTTVYKYIDHLPEWKFWHPALKDIPGEIQFQNDRISVRGTTISVVIRKPEELITEIKKDDGRPIINTLRIIRHQAQDSATLQWSMNFKLRWYPWEKFKSLFYENFYGIQMEQGLFNLKELNKSNHLSN